MYFYFFIFGFSCGSIIFLCMCVCELSTPELINKNSVSPPLTAGEFPLLLQ